MQEMQKLDRQVEMGGFPAFAAFSAPLLKTKNRKGLSRAEDATESRSTQIVVRGP
jgi:hypothetical protein